MRLPADAVIEILSGPNANGAVHLSGIVYALWENDTVALFEVDVQERRIEIKEPGSETQESTRSAKA